MSVSRNNNEPGKVGPTEVFYHALYHHVAHWAAYVASMVLLVTIGLLVSLTPIATGGDVGQRKFGAGAATVCALMAAIYFIKGMDTYGGMLNTQYLPKYYLDQALTLPHKLMILVGGVVALVVAGFDMWLIVTI